MTEPTVHRVIAGYGRSGTTWIQDALAAANSLRTVFEPLHPVHVDGADALAHRYFTESDEAPELYHLLHRFFSENYYSLWVDYRVIGKRLVPRRRDFISWQSFELLARRLLDAGAYLARYNTQRRQPGRLVKLIRANMMLPWLRENFNARIVYVIRHPVAVILSQMKAPDSWNPYDCLDRYRKDSGLLVAIDNQMKELLFRDSDEIEAFALCWCIENKIALEHAKRCGIPIVYYERLLSRGLPEWERIATALDLENSPDRSLTLQPSQQTWGRKATNAKLLQDHGSWMNHIDVSMARRIQSVLDGTGMSVYYNIDESMPLSSSEAAV